jgi:Fur family ferric uptake transcriptional regulator
MSENNPANILRQYLKDRNLRSTPERFEVLEEVMRIPGHFDTDMLYIAMRSSGSKVSRATVYASVEILTDCGLLARYRFKDKQARYEFVSGSEHHHHIICDTCGEIDEFIDKRVDRLAVQAAKLLDYELRGSALHITGTCSKCRARLRGAG